MNNRAVKVLGDVSDDNWLMPAADAASSGQDLGGRRTEAEERLTRWAEAEDREIDPGRGTSGFASQSASRALLRRAQQLHWVVTISYPDTGVAMATMDGWEDALADLDTTVARVPADAAIALRMHVVCSTEDAAIAIAAKRAGEVTGLGAKQVIAASVEA